MTSFDTVATVRKIVHQRKIGHSGTLDRFATGLLVLCTGNATRLTRFFLDSEKQYRAVVQLGISTDTDDPTGTVVREKSFDGISEADISAVLESFAGEQMQIPPSYSALKMSGKRSSDIVRSGGEVDLKPRRITVSDISLNFYEPESGRVGIDVTCSKGTYIRSIARDLGEKLSTAAHCSGLTRLRSGNFRLENAVTVDELREILSGNETSKNFRLSPVSALADFNRVTVEEDVARRVLNGAPFRREDVVGLMKKSEKEFIILDEKENLIAIADIDVDKWQIKYLNVFNT